MDWDENVRVIHVPAGPCRRLPKEQLLPYMGEFSDYLRAYVKNQGMQYDVIHANFFRSALASLPLAREMGTPLAVTFHALWKVRRQHQKEADHFSDQRFIIEEDIVRETDCLIAECPQDELDLINLYGLDSVRRSNRHRGFDDHDTFFKSGVCQFAYAQQKIVEVGIAIFLCGGADTEKHAFCARDGAADCGFELQASCRALFDKHVLQLWFMKR